jgi:hypothetical protein
MTPFNKEEFTWDGMYLMYRGRHTKSVNMEVARPDCPNPHLSQDLSMGINLGRLG